MRFTGLIIVMTALVLCSSSVLTAQEPYVVVANRSVVLTTIDQSMLQKIYLGKIIQWRNGDVIVPVTLKEGKVHEAFLKEVVKKSPGAFSNFWISQLYTGKAIPPPSFEDEEAVLDFIVATKGAVGYISKSVLTEDVTEVKVLNVVR